MEGILDFFKKITGLDPTSDQINFLEALVDLDKKNVAACAGRQTGKSLCSAVAVLWWIFEYPDIVNVLLMSSMDSYVYDHIERIFHNNPDLVKEVVVEGISGLVPLRGFQIKKGSRVHVRRGTEKQVRGLGCDIVIADEAAELSDKMITTAMGNLSGKIGKMVLLSTPHKTGLFTKIVSEAERYKYKVINWSEVGCLWHSSDSIQNKKRLMSNQEYKMEVLGQVLSLEERAFFPRDHLKKCYIENMMTEGGNRTAGLDFGQVVGKNVLTIVEWIGPRRKVLLSKSWAKKNIEDILPEIQSLVEEHKVEVIRADSKPPEYSHIIGKSIGTIQVIYIDMTFHKEASIGQLKTLVKKHTLEIDVRNVPLQVEMEKYRLHKRSGDDLVDSLSMAIYDWEGLKAKFVPKVLF